jgi:hypothetical protein
MAALQERRADRRDRLHPRRRHPGAKGDRVLPVDGAEIGEPQFFERRPPSGHAAHQFPGPPGAGAERLGRQIGRRLGGLAHLERGALGPQPRETGRQRAHRGGDRHVIVVEDHEQAAVHVAGVVHRLIGHAGGHGAVADHADRVADIPGAEIARRGKAKARGNRGRAVRRPEWVMLGFAALGEA